MDETPVMLERVHTHKYFYKNKFNKPNNTKKISVINSVI